MYNFFRSIIENSILQNIIAGFIVLILTLLVQKSIRKIRFNKINRAIPIKKSISISLGSKISRESNDGNPMVTSESVMSITNLLKFFSKFQKDPIIIVDKYGNKSPKTELEVCIGGLDSNYRTGYYLREFLPFIFLDDEKTRTVEENQGYIIKFTYEPIKGVEKRTVILLYGESTFDTLSTVSCFSNDFNKLLNNLKNDFCAFRIDTSRILGENHAKCKNVTDELKEKQSLQQI